MTLTGAIDTLAGWGIDTAVSVLSGDLGVIIYTLLGLTILWIVIAVVRSFLRK